MRKHEANVEKFQKKDDVKLPHEQARLDTCIGLFSRLQPLIIVESFDDLNNELKKDIPALMSDTDLFMATVFSQFVSVRASFFATMADLNAKIVSSLKYTLNAPFLTPI